MPLPFDATLKDMAAQGPRQFVHFLGIAAADPVSLLNVDLSTVTTATDIVFGLGGNPPQQVVHLECQTGPDEELHVNILARNALLYRHFRVPVQSIVLLLRRQARHPTLTGMVRYEGTPGRGKMDFRYEIIELWERPVEELLTFDVSLLPLAMLGRVPEGMSVEVGLASVVHRLIERVNQETTTEHGKRVVTSAFVLTGLRMNRAEARNLFLGVRAMRESDTYMAILEEGAVAEAHKMLLLQGRKLFGEPDAATKATLDAIEDIARLERFVERILDTTDWQELLQTP